MSYGNRGMSFEDVINRANEIYIEKGMAFIEKKPTPIKVINMKRGGYIHGCFDKKSSIDYSGISNGKHIAFEAKSTKHRTRFPLDMIQEHQVDALRHIHCHGGIAFFLVEFRKHKEVYVLHFEQAIEWLLEAENGGRKSIPYDWFVTNCDLVKRYKDIPLHYLNVLGVLA